MQRSKGWIVTSLAIVALIAGCATAGTTTGDPTTSGGVGQNPVNPAEPWAIKTREHLDLWLHGFAMITDDTTLVPYFRRGYRTQMAALKSRSNIVTQLDANNARLKSRMSINSGLVNAQFLALYFDSFDDIARAVDVFHRADGNPRAASDRETMETIALLAGYFPNAADRDWARLFVQSLRDEDSRFYRSYWDQQQRELGAVFTAVSSLWQNTYRARFQNFLTNTSQTAGEIYLSLPLNGEGRTLSAGKRQNATAITFPQRSSDANEAIYVLAHEVVSSLVGTAVNDNVTPTDRRLGVADRYIANGAVRAGAMLLQKIAPELANGYARYYVQSANRNAGTLATVFPLPEPIRDAIQRQLDVVLGGI
ncbi:MAG TPA: hypothetical protein VES88_11550 [Gemmatimonadaceae bacterium]|nr:hypothetical protein [Gemmatimonadaceae bacterium]